MHQVGHENLFWSNLDVFAWMGKRIAATSYLAIDIDCRLGGPYSYTSEDILRHLRSKLNTNMETLVLTQTCRCRPHGTYNSIDCNRPSEVRMARLQEIVMRSCPKLRTVVLSLDKAPAWGVHGPFLRHMCLQIPPSTIIEQDYAEEAPCARDLYTFIQMYGMHSCNLPSLQTLFLRGLREPVRLRGVDFRDSKTLEILNVQDCWIDDLSLPPTCNISVSAQSTFMMTHMDWFRGHPLVSKAHHVCLPTDLNDVIKFDNRRMQSEYGLRQRFALGIPNMFPAMRSLRMMRPNRTIRCHNYRNPGGFIRCFDYHQHQAVGLAKVKVHHMQGLSRLWQHVNLRELIIEGQSLGVTIPPLPSLETLLVDCKGSVALDFVDASRLGRTVVKMIVIGTQILIDMQQRLDLCTALNIRGLGLVGDWRKCIAVHKSNDLAPPVAELVRQAKRDLACHCGACPPCLGIGLSMVDGEETVEASPRARHACGLMKTP